MLADQPKNSDKRTETPRTSIGAQVDLFVKEIDSLAETLPQALVAIERAKATAQNQLVRFLREDGRPTSDSTASRASWIIDTGKVDDFREIVGSVQKTVLADQLVPRTFLVSLVSQFDAFLGALIRHLFRIRPQMLNSAENTLTLAELAGFGSIADAREYIVDKIVESVLRKSHAEQFEWLEAKFGMPLRTDLKVWPIFIEVTERRNLFVHANGMVSRQYLDVCRKHESQLDDDARLGATLFVSREYFKVAHECLFEIGVKLSQVLWRKVAPDDIASADASLTRAIYELLRDERYDLAGNLSDFATLTLKKHSNEEQRLIMVVNRALAYKYSGRVEDAALIVNSEDWSAMRLRFRMAQAVLLDDFKRVLNLMREIGRSEEEVPKSVYRSWPLFKEVRRLPEFGQAFEEIFGEPLNRVTLDDELPPPGQPIN